METEIVKIENEKDDLDKITRAAELIDRGALVAFPTETVYGIACSAQAKTLNRLDKLKGRTAEKHYTIHIADKRKLHKFVPDIGLRAKKLTENAWPGPLTIVFELTSEDILKIENSFQKDVFERLYKNNSIGIRCPNNPVASKLLDLTDYPVVAPSANITGEPPPTKAQQVLDKLNGQIELILDNGPCKYKKSSTVARITPTALEILRDGAYSKKQLETISKVQFLFVCTGNTCRSPMAEGIFKKYLAEKLGCSVDQLEAKGYKVCSAGTMGLSNLPASPDAIAVCASRGIDISSHKTRSLSSRLIEQSDCVFAMGQTHQTRILGLSPEAVEKCVLLAEKTDINDPIGQSRDVYNNCAIAIERAIKKRTGELRI